MVPNSQDKGTESNKTRRRHFLQIAGVLGTAGLAGCTSDDGDGEVGNGATDGNGGNGDSGGSSSDDGGNGSDDSKGGDGSNGSDDGKGDDGGNETQTQGGDPVDPTFSTSIGTNPTDLQYNNYNATGESSAEVEAMIFEPLVKNDKANNEWIPVTVSSWEFSGDTVSLEIDDGYVWHDGDQVTADDLAIQFRIDLALEQPTSDFVEEIEVTGDHSLELTLSSDSVNTDLFILNVLDRSLYTKADLFEEYVQPIEEAESDEEREEAQNELLEWRIEEPIGSGPFQFESADTQRVLTTKFEDYPDADLINFDEYEFLFMGGNQERWQGLMNDSTDGEPHLGITQEVLNQMPDHVDLIRPPEADGVSLLFQHEDSAFSDPRVRKAITYILDGELLTGDSTLNYQFEELAMNTGMMPTQAETYLSDELLSSLTNYNVDQSEAEDQATELLEEAGYSLENGTWMTPDGNTFELPIKTIGDWWSIQAQSITGQLQEFGIQAEFSSQDLGTFFEDISEGNYEMAIEFFGGDHPSQTFSTVFDVNDGGTNVPAEVEVPMPVGDPDGSTEIVNVRELVDQMRNTRDEDEVQEIIEELAWAYNQTLPRVPHLIGTGMTFLTNDDWEYPDPDDPLMEIFDPPFWLPRIGELQAKTQ